MAVLLFPNRRKDAELAVTRQIAALLRGFDIAVFAPQDFAAELRGAPIECAPFEDVIQKADQVLTIGGDGTLLQAGKFCVTYGKPVLGINLGRTGFLATCEVSQLSEKLEKLAKGAFTLTPRSLLSAYNPTQAWRQLAINDVSLFGASRLHPMDYMVYCDDVFVSSYRSDGIIAATPTGSTAYSLSAGGPILDAAMPAILITPVCAHGIQAKPLVFAPTRRITIVAPKDNRDDIFASADGQKQCTLAPGQTLELTTAPQCLDLITFDSAEQFRAIENKLTRR